MIYFTVGPTQLHPVVNIAIKKSLKNGILSISHRSQEFDELFESTVLNLKTLLKIPESHSVFFVSSGTECMERIVQNMAISNTFHLVNGAFSKRFYDISNELGKNPLMTKVPDGESFDWKKIEVPKDNELLCVTQNETSTGVSTSLDWAYEQRKIHHELLVAVDTVSSMPYANIDFDQSDAVFFSVQKGFGLPSGLGVMIMSDRAIMKSHELEVNNVSSGSYHSFRSLKNYADKFETPETPNVLGIFVFNEVLKNMNEVGIENIRIKVDENAKLIESFINNNEGFEYLAKNSDIRSKTVHVIKADEGSTKIVNKLRAKGFEVSRGYGSMKDTCIRIANYPSHKVEDLEELLRFLK